MKLTDSQWEILDFQMHVSRHRSDPTMKNVRGFIDAVKMVSEGECTWSGLPPEYGKSNSIYMRFIRWHKDWRWEQLLQQVSKDSELCAIVQRIVKLGDDVGKNKKGKRQRINPESDWITLAAGYSPLILPDL